MTFSPGSTTPSVRLSGGDTSVPAGKGFSSYPENFPSSTQTPAYDVPLLLR